jgi:hypothetical protein
VKHDAYRAQWRTGCGDGLRGSASWGLRFVGGPSALVLGGSAPPPRLR